MTTSDSIPQKRCPKCGEVFPATTEHFYRSKWKRDGFVSHCKTCVQKRKQQYTAEHAEAIRESNRLYRLNNPDKRRESNRQWALKNPDKTRENARRYRERHPERSRASVRRWRLENQEKNRALAKHYYSKNPQKNRERSNRWRLENLDRHRASENRRRARKLSLPDTFTNEDQWRAMEYFNGCCAVCGRQLKDLFSTHTAAMDHWIPLSKGGGSTTDNMVPLCHGVDGCNNSKRDHMPNDWLNRNFKPSQVKAILSRINAYFEWIKKQDQ